VRLVVGGDGALYMLQGSGGWTLIVNPISDGEIAGLRQGAALSAVVAVEFFQNPMSLVAAPAPAAATDDSGATVTPTDATRRDIVNAVINYNGYWQQAQASADASRMSNAARGQELADDIAEVGKLRAAGQSRKLYQTAFNVTDFTWDGAAHAVVHTTETWSGEIDSFATHQLLQRIGAVNYVETYTLDFVDGRWIVTLDELSQV
jgi:hypothetical protein